jgi:hypothetical protein
VMVLAPSGVLGGLQMLLARFASKGSRE